MSMHTRQALWFIAAVISLAAAGLAILGRVQGTAPGVGGSTTPTMVPTALRPAPDFRLRTIEGRIVSLSDFREQAIVLNFWASWCTPCKQEMPNLERAWRASRHPGLVVLGIDVQDDPSDATSFLQRLQITYRNLYDPGSDRIYAYGVTSLPTTFLIDREMRIRGRFSGGYLGPEGYRELRRQIDALLNTR